MAINAGMKRKAQSAPASPLNKREAKASQKVDASRKSKKPKVEKIFDPTEEPLNELINALNGPLGDELTSEVVAMTKHIVNDALKTLAEDRSTLHTAYVSLVGECFSTATVALCEKAAVAAAVLGEVEEVNTTHIAAVEAAKENLTLCKDATSEAKDALVQAEAARDQTVSELDAKHTELSNLENAKEQQLIIAADMSSSLELVMSPEATSTDGKKVCGSLKSIGASDSMLKSAAPALGHWNSEGFEAMILQQIAKVISAKAAEVESVLADWDNHCANLKAEAQRLETLLAANKATIEECKTEIETTTASQKEASTCVKEAEVTQKKQQQIVNSKTKAKLEADGIVTDAEAAGKAFLLLQIRTSIVPEEPVVVAEVEMEEPTVVTEVVERVVEDVEMAEPMASSPMKEPAVDVAEQMMEPTPKKDASPIEQDDSAENVINVPAPLVAATPVNSATPVKEPTAFVQPEQTTPTPVKAPAPVKEATPVKLPTAFDAPEQITASETTSEKSFSGLVHDHMPSTQMKSGQAGPALHQSPARLSSHGA